MSFRYFAVPRFVFVLAVVAVIGVTVAFFSEPHRIGHAINQALAPSGDNIRKGGGGRYRAEKEREERQIREARLVSGAAVTGATSR